MPLPHIMISASAGSGKTYQLVRRYLHLLALGVEPRRIAAMTFTRKAAGEFFNRILNRLSDLASGQLDPDQFFAGLKPQPAQWPDFLQLLRQVTQSMQQLRLGTLDSFFASVQACFPLELGLPLGASVMDENAAADARTKVLGDLIDRIYRERDEARARALLEGYKSATFGSEEKKAADYLEKWVTSSHDLWLESAEADHWGNPQRIWPDTSAPARRDPLPSLSDAVARLRRAIDPDAFFVTAKGKPSANADKWRDMVDDLLLTEPGMSLRDSAKKVLEKCAEVWDELLAGDAEMSFWTSKRFSGEQAAALVAVCEALLARELIVRCQRTRGTASVVGSYEEEYARGVRGQGRLSFGDVQRLLARAAQDWLAGGDGAEALWYRLDSRFEHWLFDEFQDTSVQQWQVVRGLVEETLQADDGTRSFFAVGDPKQSIYLWRQAEPRLFQQIMDAHPQEGELGRGIERHQLSESRRSAQPVLDMVNAVCGNEAELARLLPGCTSDFQFIQHLAHKATMPGYAALLHPAEVVGDEEQLKADDLAVALLQAIQPLSRGLTCAVLVRGNETARELADKLRLETGMEVVCESQQTPATDNPATLALLSLLQLAAHPGDSYALEHLRMTPLWPVMQRIYAISDATETSSPSASYQADAASLAVDQAVLDLLDSLPLTEASHSEAMAGQSPASSEPLLIAKLAAEVQRVLFHEGFVGLAKLWIQRVEPLLELSDGFTRLRLRQFSDMAAEFDESGSRDIDAFIERARSFTLRTRGAKAAIQVMTVHASKGLEFDMVVLPDLEGDGMNYLRPRDLIRSRDAEGQVRWVLQEPPAVYAKLDDVLATERKEASQRIGFESLCRLYVAMTRAKHGLYLITQPPAKTSKAEFTKTSRLLHEILGTEPQQTDEPLHELPAVVTWQQGQREWFAGRQPEAVEAPTTRPKRERLGSLLRRLQPMARRLTPSGEEDFRLKGSVHFSQGRSAGRELGSLVHALFEQVEWLHGTVDEAALHQRWQGAGLDQQAVFNQAREQVLRVLHSPACQAAFAQPSPHAQLWRERPFDLMLDDRGWLSGVFDRVIVECSATGKPERASIIDFKTDDAPSEEALLEKVAGYKPQLELYRDAVSRLTSLDLAQISATLVFTRSARMVQVL